MTGATQPVAVDLDAKVVARGEPAPVHRPLARPNLELRPIPSTGSIRATFT